MRVIWNQHQFSAHAHSPMLHVIPLSEILHTGLNSHVKIQKLALCATTVIMPGCYMANISYLFHFIVELRHKYTLSNSLLLAHEVLTGLCSLKIEGCGF